MKRYIKEIHKELLLESLENIKKNISQNEIEIVNSFINKNEDEFCFVATNDPDLIHRLNVLELETYNFEVVLEDSGSNLEPDLFEPVFWETINSKTLDFIFPHCSGITPDNFDKDASAYIEVSKMNISFLKSNIESVYREFHEHLNNRCFDTNEMLFDTGETTLDFDDYTLIEYQ